MTQLDESLMPTRELVKKYNIETLVETGCLYGHGLEFGTLFNLKMYTCDIVKQYADECAIKHPTAVVKHADSLDFLKEILPTLGSTRTLFWLDAHFPVKYAKLVGAEDQITENEVNRFPEFEEMELIKTLKQDYQNDIIMMDDVWCVDDGVNELYGNLLPEESYNRHTVEELSSIFKDTHDCMVVKQYSGVLVFTPKN